MNVPSASEREMNERFHTLNVLRTFRLVAVVRAEHMEGVGSAVDSLVKGGIRCIEITMTVPEPTEAIRKAYQQNPGILVGAGTVLSVEEVEACVAAGARFVVSPIYDSAVVKAAHRLGAVAIPGAMTPTEVVMAWRGGADLVKIFPAGRLGARFLIDLKGPFPNIPLMPTGGIDDQTAPEFLRAGAEVVCAGSWLVDRTAMARRDFEVLTNKARRLVAAVQQDSPLLVSRTESPTNVAPRR